MRSIISTVLFPNGNPQPAKTTRNPPVALTKALEVLRGLDYPIAVRQLAELAGVSLGTAQRAVKMSAEQTGAVRVVYADTGRSRTVAMFSAKEARE